MGGPPPRQPGLLSPPGPGAHVIRPGMAPPQPMNAPLLNAPPHPMHGGVVPGNYPPRSEPPSRFGLLQTPQQ